MTDTKTIDALIIPTGETTFERGRFPVTDEAIKLFNSGKYGCIFITGGYSGFATKERKESVSEGNETYEYIVWERRGISPRKVYVDDQSLESVGNFTFPIVKPMINPYTKKDNPNFNDFNNMMIIGKEGHIWRLEDYAKITMPKKYKDGNIGFHSIPGEHNNGLMAKVYHRGIMNAIKDKNSVEDIHDFLMKKHPFYSEGWYDKPVLERKALMAAVGGLWRLGFEARLK
jgi:hypothetical protein